MKLINVNEQGKGGIAHAIRNIREIRTFVRRWWYVRF